jgi:hypothetical protein
MSKEQIQEIGQLIEELKAHSTKGVDLAIALYMAWVKYQNERKN